MRISNMSWFFLVCLVTVLTSDLVIAQSQTKWIKKESYHKGTCTTSYRPDASPTDFFSVVGCNKKDHCDITKGYEGTDPNNFQSISQLSQKKCVSAGTLIFGELLAEESRNICVQNISERYLLCTNFSLRYGDLLVGEKENKSLQTTSIFLTGKKVELKTVLWICGGTFAALVLGLTITTICCVRGKCLRNTQQELPATSLPRSYPAQPGTERPQRPEARVPPFINQGTVSGNEESLSLLSPDRSHQNSYSAIENQSDRSDHSVRRLSSQNHSHPINVQGDDEFLRPAPILDPNSITEDRSHWNYLE